MLIDVFPYAYGPEVLLLRLQELADVVDVHVLVECPVTHTGQSRGFAWPELVKLEAFAPFRDRVQWCTTVYPAAVTKAWAREEWIRSACLLHAGALASRADDVILFADHDEIPNPRALCVVLEEGIKRARLWGRYHEWWLNLRAKGSPGHLWEFRQPITFLAGDPLATYWGKESGQELRALQWQACDDVTELGRHGDDPLTGWHMTLQGGAEDVWSKLQAGAHTELQRFTPQDVQALISARHDILSRCVLERVPTGDLPRTLQNSQTAEPFRRMMLQ